MHRLRALVTRSANLLWIFARWVADASFVVRRGTPARLKAVWEHYGVAWVLIVVSGSYALWWARHTPVPGYAVAVISVVAALMSVRKDSPPQNFAWLLIIACLLLIEFKAIRVDRQASATEQIDRFKKQQERFNAIAHRVDTSIEKIDSSTTKIDDSTKTNDEHFAKAAEQATGILSAARTSETLAGNALNQITGAGSYPYIVPLITPENPRVIPLEINSVGENMLTNVSVTMHRLSKADAGNYLKFNLAPEDYVGVVHSLYPKKLHRPIVPELEVGASFDDYMVDIYTQTKIYYELIQFKPAPSGHGWTAVFWVSEIHTSDKQSHMVCQSRGWPLDGNGQMPSSMKGVPFCGEP